MERPDIILSFSIWTGDGKDEVFVGFALIDHDGTELWKLDDEGGHSDANFIVRAEGETRLFFGNGDRDPATLYLYDWNGNELWRRVLLHCRHVLVVIRPLGMLH